MLTLLAIAIAGGVVVFFRCFQISAWEAAIESSVSLFEGHAQIQHPTYRDRPRMNKTIRQPAEIKASLERDPSIKAVAARARAFSLVSSETRSYGVQIVGVEPEREKLVSRLPQLVRKGRYLNQSDSTQAVIGASLAANLQIELGDELTLLGQGKDGSVAAQVLTVVGIFESGARELDRMLLEMPLHTFQELYAMEGEVHSIAVVGTNLSELEPLLKSIEARLTQTQQLRVLSWEELMPGLRQAVDLDIGAAWLFYISLIAIVSFTIFNTFLMSVVERTRELGVMISIGTKPYQIGQFVLCECAFLTFIGLLLGIVAGCVVVLYFGRYGLKIPGSGEISKMWGLPSVVYPRLTAATVLIGPIWILVTSLFTALYPMFRAAKVEPLPQRNF